MTPQQSANEPEELDPRNHQHWHWYTPPGSHKDLVHLVPGNETSTLCGIPTDENFLTDVPDHESVLPENRAYCSNCRVKWAKQLLGKYAIDPGQLDEGDVVRFWQGDPTSTKSGYPVRKVGVVTRTPPYTMEFSGRKDDVIRKDRVEVKVGESVPTFAHTDPRHIFEQLDKQEAETVREHVEP